MLAAFLLQADHLSSSRLASSSLRRSTISKRRRDSPHLRWEYRSASLSSDLRHPRENKSEFVVRSFSGNWRGDPGRIRTCNPRGVEIFTCAAGRPLEGTASKSSAKARRHRRRTSMSKSPQGRARERAQADLEAGSLSAALEARGQHGLPRRATRARRSA